MRLNSGKIVAAILASTMLLQGCQAANQEEKQTIANVQDDVGEEDTYSEGASFSIENGEAILTLNNYNGGMIAAGGYGSLTIRLAEGSVNNINAAEPDIE